MVVCCNQDAQRRFFTSHSCRALLFSDQGAARVEGLEGARRGSKTTAGGSFALLCGPINMKVYLHHDGALSMKAKLPKYVPLPPLLLAHGHTDRELLT